MKTMPIALATCTMVLAACGGAEGERAVTRVDYDVVVTGTRQFEWDTDTGPGVIKVLLEQSNLGGPGAEVAEIYFPPGYHGTTHPHELEIIYVLDGELDHIVNGESHILGPGMIGVVREPDLVVHRTHSPGGVRVLVFWSLGGEVEGFAGMRETALH
jgi:quercetin dioxygenase-like cupin family protein